MDGRKCENKQHGDTVPEKARDMFLCSLHINIKERVIFVSVLLMMSGTRTKKNCQWNPSGRQLSTIFVGGVSRSGLRGTFSSIYRLTMETKMCRFSTILDSSTLSTSRQRVFEILFRWGWINFQNKLYHILWLLLHLFLNLLTDNENRDVPIQEYLEFSHALYLLPKVFQNSYLLRKIANPPVKVVIVLPL